MDPSQQKRAVRLSWLAIALWATTVARGPQIVAAEAPNHQLCVIRPDGTGRRQVTHDPLLRFGAPSFSPDGRRIAADCTAAEKDMRTTNVVVMDADGSNIRDLGPGSMPSWSPKGTHLTFHVYGQADFIAVMSADGSGREEVTNHWGSPRWLPRGDKILSLDNRDGHFRVLDLKSGVESVMRVPFRGAAYQGFGVSADGTRLCFGDQTRGGLAVATIDANWQITDVKRFLRDQRCTFCSWSPDATRVVFAMQSNDQDKAQLYVLSVHADEPPQRLKDQNPAAGNVNPQWSPDGEWIVFTSDLPD